MDHIVARKSKGRRCSSGNICRSRHAARNRRAGFRLPEDTLRLRTNATGAMVIATTHFSHDGINVELK
jgi:hypothetical protein